MVKYSRLGRPPPNMADLLAAHLMPVLAHLPAVEQIAYLRLFLVALARRQQVTGASIVAIATTTAQDLLSATARVLTLLLPDAQGIRDAVDGVWAEIVAAHPAGPSQVQVSPLSSPPRSTTSASQGSTPAAALGDSEVAVEALRLIGEQFREKKPWRSSHDLTVDDDFTAPQLAALRALPPYGWTADDENRDLLLRAVRHIARHLTTNATTPIVDMIAELRKDLKMSRRTLAPTWIAGLQMAIHTSNQVAIRHAIAELSLTAEFEADENLFPRLVLARSMPRTDNKNAQSVLAAKSTVVVVVGELPVRLRERISRLS